MRVRQLSMLVLAARVLCRASEEHEWVPAPHVDQQASLRLLRLRCTQPSYPTHPRSACLHANFCARFVYKYPLS